IVIMLKAKSTHRTATSTAPTKRSSPRASVQANSAASKQLKRSSDERINNGLASWTPAVTALLKFLALSASAVLTSDETLISIQFEKHRPVSLGVVSQTPLLSAYPGRANSLKTHGFLSSTYLTLHLAERRDVMLFHVDSGLFLALLMTLNQTDLAPYKFHGSYLSGSVAQARRVIKLAFMGFLFFLLRNVMLAISVAQARRVAELAFMGFLFFLLRNVMIAISVAQARRVTEVAFHDIQRRDQSDSES
ncbi:hypothetical protein P5673_030452, partial [Acropora cervicornis]